MSKIDIKVTETASPVSFLATENTVLVPLYVKSAMSWTVKKFTDKATFIAEFSDASEGEAAKVTGITAGSDTVPDLSYDMIKKLLSLGFSVLVKAVVRENDFASVHAAILAINTALVGDSAGGIFSGLESKNNYNFKFITSGAYANFGAEPRVGEESQDTTLVGYKGLLDLATARKDAIALLATVDSCTDVSTLLNAAYLDFTGRASEYSAITFPSVEIGEDTNPGAYGYLSALGTMIADGNPDYRACAGSSRGLIPGLTGITAEVTEGMMHNLQGDTDSNLIAFANPIMHTNPDTIRLWGNRTCHKTLKNNVYVPSFRDDLNTMIMLCDIDKQVRAAANLVTFEPDDDLTWSSFTAMCATLLDDMTNNRGLDYYYWEREVAEQGVIKATLVIRPIKAVDDFEITIRLTDEIREVNA